MWLGYDALSGHAPTHLWFSSLVFGGADTEQYRLEYCSILDKENIRVFYTSLPVSCD